MYVSWWTLALAIAGIACIVAAIAFRGARRSTRWAVAAVGIVLVSGWMTADLVGPGPAIHRDSDPALDPGAVFYTVHGFPYRQLTSGCRSESEMRANGVYAGALPLKGSLVPAGHIVGWFGGPEVFEESGADPSAPVYVEVQGDCYVTYVTVVG